MSGNQYVPNSSATAVTHTFVAKTEGVTKRDLMGFVTSDVLNLSNIQVQFILTAAHLGSTSDAADEMGLETPVVMGWFDDDEFRAIYDSFMRNKREGVKQISGQLLPQMLLELGTIIQNGSNKEKLTAAKLLAQMQGLLITQAAPVDRGTLEALREELMKPRPLVTYRTVEDGS